MNQMPGGNEGAGSTSPVPEWFGREEQRAPVLSRSGGGFGCLLLMFCLAGLGAWFFYSATSDARAKKVAQERDRCQSELRTKTAELDQYKAELRARASRPAPTATPPSVATTAAPSETEPSTEPREGALRPSDVMEVTKKLNPGFRRCYDQALAENPNAEARVQLQITIDPSGKVSDARATGPGGPTGLPLYAFRCIEAVAKGARFPAATEKTVFTMPLTFRSQP